MYKRGIARDRWMRVRTLILLRDPICQVCGKNPSTEIDHRFDEGGLRERYAKNGYLSDEDKYDPANLEGLCHKCHAERTKIDRQHRKGR